jgi:hypothetical protein
MATNKVTINTENGEETIIDLTKDTVTPEALAEGVTAHDASGEVITGEMPITTVLYTEQTLNEAQKAQARGNIDALGEADVIDNLETPNSNKALSANQGVALMALILQIIEEFGVALEDKLDISALQNAINTALAQAKESGEFDGSDGVGISGVARASTNGLVDTYRITFTNGNTKYFDVTNGKDGISPKVTLSRSGKAVTIETEDAFGADRQIIYDGEDGADGTSVTVSSVSESTVDGGSNIVTFSDGKTVTIKNGSKGSKGDKGDKGDTGDQGIQGIQGEKGDKGDTGASGTNGKDGTSVTVSNVSESTASGGSNVVTFSDGKKVTIKNGINGTNGKDGTDGANGKDGTSGVDGVRGSKILKVTTAPSSYTTATGGFTPTYRIALSTVLSQSGASDVLKNDAIWYSYYHYPVGYVDASYVYLGARQTMRGATGSAGTTPVKGTDYWTEADKQEIKTYVDGVIAGIETALAEI